VTHARAMFQIVGACVLLFASGFGLGAMLSPADTSASWRDLALGWQETSGKWETLAHQSQNTAQEAVKTAEDWGDLYDRVTAPCYSAGCKVLTTEPLSLPIVGCMVFNDKGTMDRLRIPGVHGEAKKTDVINPMTHLPLMATQMGSCRAYDDATDQWVELRNPEGFVPPVKP
jgi:hypothetical protein